MIDREQFPILTYEKADFLISTDPMKLDIDVIHHFLANESYWAKGVTRETVVRSLQHSLVYGVYRVDGRSYRQIGLARVITDFATYAYLSDVFILPAYRGQGLGKWLVQCILQNPNLQTIRRFVLDTKDAHSLYALFGFKMNPAPEKNMIFRPSDSS